MTSKDHVERREFPNAIRQVGRYHPVPVCPAGADRVLIKRLLDGKFVSHTKSSSNQNAKYPLARVYLSHIVRPSSQPVMHVPLVETQIPN
jgi:hypothetical protein